MDGGVDHTVLLTLVAVPQRPYTSVAKELADRNLHQVGGGIVVALVKGDQSVESRKVTPGTSR